MAAVDSAIADLKAQFEKVVAPLQAPRDATESVQVEQPVTGRWLFRVRTRRSLDCRFEPPRSFWLASTRISTKLPDLYFVGARYEGARVLVVIVETKQFAQDQSNTSELDWAARSGFDVAREVFDEPVRNVVARRSWRALHRVFSSASAERLEDVASQSTDVAVVARALEQPEAIEAFTDQDPFAAVRLRGVRERERLLAEEGGTWSVEQVAKHLHLTRQTVNLKRKQDSLLGLDAGRHGFRYPAWQFVRTGTIVGLEPTLAALQHVDPWMRQIFMVSQNARLDEQRPIDVLRAGDLSAVVNAAAAFGEHGAA